MDGEPLNGKFQFSKAKRRIVRPVHRDRHVPKAAQAAIDKILRDAFADLTQTTVARFRKDYADAVGAVDCIPGQINILVDPPDENISPDAEWTAFLIEMRRARNRATDDGTIAAIDGYIKRAEIVLQGRLLRPVHHQVETWPARHKVSAPHPLGYQVRAREFFDPSEKPRPAPLRDNANIFVNELAVDEPPGKSHKLDVRKGVGDVWNQSGTRADIIRQAREGVVKLGGNQQEYLAIVGPTKDNITTVGLVAGDEHSADFPQSFRDALTGAPGEMFDAYHNHPLPYPLSTGDLGFLNSKPQIASIREDDGEGGWSSASIPGRTGTTHVDWKGFDLEVDAYYDSLHRNLIGSHKVTGPHDGVLQKVKNDLVARNAGREAIDVPQFIMQHAANVGLDAAGVIHYEFHPSPRQQRWIDTYKTEFDQAMKVATAAAKVFPKEKNEYTQAIDGQWYPKLSDTARGNVGIEFVSPNVKSDLDFSGAVDALAGSQQIALRKASADIDHALKLDSAQSDVVGAWADGAENSLMTTVEGADWEALKLSAAMKGYLADQKSVLIFQQQDQGEHLLYHFAAKGDLDKIHADLLQDGLAFHTLVPGADGAMVYVADLDGSAHEAVEKGAARYGSKVTGQRGRAEFVGSQDDTGTDREQRDRSLKVYQGIIDQSEFPGSAQIWARVRDSWGQNQGVAVSTADRVADSSDLTRLSRTTIHIENELFTVHYEAQSYAIEQHDLPAADYDNVMDNDAAAYARARSSDLVGQVTETTRNVIRDTIADGMASGATVDDIAADLAASTGFSDSRARMIARTEVSQASNSAAVDAMFAARDAGLPLRKQWELGDNPCPICEENGNDGPIAIEDTFSSGDDAPPLHPNCECDVVSVIDDDFAGDADAAADNDSDLPADDPLRDTDTSDDNTLRDTSDTDNTLRDSSEPQDVPDADAVVPIKGYDPGIKAADDLDDIAAVKSGWFAASPINTIDDAVAQAPAAQRALGRAGRDIASDLDVTFKDPGVKTKDQAGIDRTIEKAQSRGGVERVTDIARATFVIDEPQQTEQIAAELGKQFEVTLEPWKQTPLGYLDRAMTVRFNNGVLGEIQMMDQGMATAKSDVSKGGGGGHALYVQSRDPDTPPERRAELDEASRALYGAVTDNYSPAWKAALGSAGK